MNRINKSIDGFDSIYMWLSEDDSGNEIFDSTNAIMMDVILRKMEELGFKGDNQQLLPQLFDLTLKAAKLFREFCILYFTDSILDGIDYKDESGGKIRATSLSRVNLPFFVINDIT